MAKPATVDLAQRAYEDYSADTAGEDWRVQPLPAWSDLEGRIQSAWVAAVNAIERTQPVSPDAAT